MKYSFILDENFSNTVANALIEKKFDILAIRQGIRGISDRDIVELSNAQSRIILTFDKDFGELVFKNNLKPYGVILLRLQDHKPSNIIIALENFFKNVIQYEITLAHHFIVFNNQTIRVKSI